MYRVLIVENSPVDRERLAVLFSLDSGLQVVGTASDGNEALEAVARLRPDVVTIDVHIAGPGGPETTRMIMERHPTPVVVIANGVGDQETSPGFQALSAGALAVAFRPTLIDPDDSSSRDLLRMVKLMAEIKVVRRIPARQMAAATPGDPRLPQQGIRVAVIGASTGGPAVLGKLFAALPSNLAFPVLVVQHISSGFLEAMLQWMQKTVPLSLVVAADGETAAPGSIYFAPNGFQMEIEAGLRIRLQEGQGENGLSPSVNSLFRSAARNYGAEALGILLTGMGMDGAEGLKILRDLGGLTVAQDEASSVVFGMPGEAVRRGAALHVLSPDSIAHLLGGAS